MSDYFPLLELTESAITMMRQDSISIGGGIRLSVTSGGCFGVSYTLDFVEKPMPQDADIKVDDLHFFVPQFAQSYIQHLKIDWLVSEDELPEDGEFVITRLDETEPLGRSC